MKSLTAPSLDHPTKGMLCMLLAVGMFCAMDACMKQLTQHYGPMQITSLRALFAWPLIVAWLITTNRVQHLLNSRWSLHLLRALLGIVMLSAFVYAIQYFDQNDFPILGSDSKRYFLGCFHW